MRFYAVMDPPEGFRGVRTPQIDLLIKFIYIRINAHD